MNLALRALNRFGLGARPGEASSLSDPRGWLESQLDGSRWSGPTDGLPSIRDRTDAFRELRISQQTFQIDSDRTPVEAAIREIRRIGIGDQQAALRRRATTTSPFLERLVAFWSNHLCVSTGQRAVALLAGPYEDEAIRPHVLGRFENMVMASAKHPAMLLYLNNAQSIDPNSRAGRRSGPNGRSRGLNENYARELMELHTIGVDGGYTQDDVRTLAHILTGWGVSGVGPLAQDVEEIGFRFRPIFHDARPRTLMEQTLDPDGLAQGEASIRALCSHPATARFVSMKLVRHFVSDVPPVDAVEAIERAWLESDGDLRVVSRAIVQLDDAWADENMKYRTPQDWLVASLRALDIEEIGPQLTLVLNPLRQSLWAPASPKGYGDTLREWADPDGLMNRAELARSIADRLAKGGTDPRSLLTCVQAGASSQLAGLLDDRSIPGHERIALALAAPAFQWR